MARLEGDRRFLVDPGRHSHPAEPVGGVHVELPRARPGQHHRPAATVGIGRVAEGHHRRPEVRDQSLSAADPVAAAAQRGARGGELLAPAAGERIDHRAAGQVDVERPRQRPPEFDRPIASVGDAPRTQHHVMLAAGAPAQVDLQRPGSVAEPGEQGVPGLGAGQFGLAGQSQRHPAAPARVADQQFGFGDLPSAGHAVLMRDEVFWGVEAGQPGFGRGQRGGTARSPAGSLQPAAGFGGRQPVAGRARAQFDRFGHWPSPRPTCWHLPADRKRTAFGRRRRQLPVARLPSGQQRRAGSTSWRRRPAGSAGRQ